MNLKRQRRTKEGDDFSSKHIVLEKLLIKRLDIYKLEE